jgi:hypothetical protein
MPPPGFFFASVSISQFESADDPDIRAGRLGRTRQRPFGLAPLNLAADAQRDLLKGGPIAVGVGGKYST